MENSDRSSFSEVSELQVLHHVEDVASCSTSSASDREICAEFAVLLESFEPILQEMKSNDQIIDTFKVRAAVGSLEKELVRVNDLVESSSSRFPVKQIEDLAQDLGRSLDLVLFASTDVCEEIKEKIAVLYKQLTNAKFDTSLCPRSSLCSSVDPSLEPSKASEIVGSEKEIEEEKLSLGMDDVVLHLKHGEDEHLRLALLGLKAFISDQVVSEEWIEDEKIIQILLNRLGSSKPANRLIIIQMLRILALVSSQNKETMANTDSLSVLVKSLTRDTNEQREVVGLLMELSSVSSIRRRLGRIQGCIFMLVTILSGDDPTASHDAGKLLTALSGNAQNALHMAEAGYFRPLVQHLQEGSDMSKILMATAISRMELTDQNRVSFGEDGAIEPLVVMFKTGKLEAKLSALNALQNLSGSTENIHRLVNLGFVVPLLQLLFSVTSVLMTLREPAAAILAKIAQSDTVLVKQDVVQQMLSLLNLSSPTIQCYLLQALNSIVSHSKASKIRRKMKENCAVQLLFPFLTEGNIKVRTAALNLLFTLSKDSPTEFMEQLGESHLHNLINIVSSSTSYDEKAAAAGIICNLPASDKQVTDILKKSKLLPVLISELKSSLSASASTRVWLSESIAGIFVRFTVPSDKKLQLLSAEQGVIPLLVKLLSSGSVIAKSRAATSLAQLSQNTVALSKRKKSRRMCMPPNADSFCEIHDGHCTVKSTFCLVKADAIPPLIKILEGKDREADEAVIGALATLVQDEIWGNGSKCIANLSGVQIITRWLESGSVKAQEKALLILERIFRVEELRTRHGSYAQMVLIDLAQNGEARLKSAVAKVLAQLELLQIQSSYF